MAQARNTFSKSKMNKDLDARLMRSDEYRDARNIQVSRSEGANVGSLENVLGNELLLNINTLTGSTGQKCIGYFIDETKFGQSPGRDRGAPRGSRGAGNSLEHRQRGADVSRRRSLSSSHRAPRVLPGQSGSETGRSGLLAQGPLERLEKFRGVRKGDDAAAGRGGPFDQAGPTLVPGHASFGTDVSRLRLGNPGTPGLDSLRV